MNLHIDQVVQLWEIVKFHPLKYFVGPRAFGEARYVISSCDMEIVHARRVIWGPVRKWGSDYPDKLEYEWLEIHHPECYVEVMAPYNTLLYYCKDLARRRMSHAFFKHTYDLDHVGDVSHLHEALTYHDLIQGTPT